MPIEEIHRKKLKKNLAVLAMLFGFCALIFAVSITKMAMNAKPAPAIETPAESPPQ